MWLDLPENERFSRILTFTLFAPQLTNPPQYRIYIRALGVCFLVCEVLTS